MIQDYLMTIVGIMFSYSLIPQILRCIKLKSAKELSWNFLIITFIGMVIVSVCILTMKCYFTFVVDIITSIFYMILIILKIKYTGGK